VSIDDWREGNVLVVRINRPEARNAFDPETSSAFGRVLTAAETDDSVRAVVLTGAGEKAFSSGMDLKAFAARRGAAATPSGPGIETVMRRVYPKPLVAAVNGTAVAGGFDLMLSCDLAVAADHAQFGIPEVKRGLVGAGCSTKVAQRLPLALALELALTGDLISAEQALALGLVNRVVPGDRVLPEAIALAGRICENAPLAVRAAKAVVYEEIGRPDWEHLRTITDPVFASEDAQEGARAFAERRTPQWRGR
jgi:enoyl-CoA hydratase